MSQWSCRSAPAGEAGGRGEVRGSAGEAERDDIVPVAAAGGGGEAVEAGQAGAGVVEGAEGPAQQTAGG